MNYSALKVICAAAVSISVFGSSPVLAQEQNTYANTATQVMHRLYNPNSGEHFYTANKTEKNHLVEVGWKYEGTGWTAPVSSDTPVYRLYNANAGDHHYTLNAYEKDQLVKLGWKYEGIGWYSADKNGQPLYRQYNPNAKSGSHNYTSSKHEHEQLVKIGWKDEGIGWYGIKDADLLAADQSMTVGTTEELTGCFSPLYVSSPYDQWVTNMVFQSMLAYDENSNLYPQAASELPAVSEDGRTITYKLRKGLKFSDGSALTAEDVKFTFTLMADPEYKGQRLDGTYNFIEGWNDYQRGSAKQVSGITVKDDYTITFKCETSDIDAAATIGGAYILPSDLYKYSKGNMGDYKNETTNIVGSGPYKVDTFDRYYGATVILNDNYKGTGEYTISPITIRTIADGTETAALDLGDIDYLPEEINPDIIGPASLLDGITTDHYFRAAEGYFGYNCEYGPTSDPAVRQALSYAVNREAFAEVYYAWPQRNGVDLVSNSIKSENVSVGYVPAAFWTPVGKGMSDYTTGKKSLDGLVTYEYDLEKAKKILDEAGWVDSDNDGIREKDGEKLEIKFLASEGNSVLEILIPMIKYSWCELGVDMRQNTLEFNTLADVVDPTNDGNAGDWNVYFMAVSYKGLTNTTMCDLLGYQKDGSSITLMGSNYARIVDEQLNTALWAGKQTTDEKVSLENFKKAMIRTSELCPYFPIYGNELFNIYSSKIKNLNTGPVCNWSQALDGAYIASGF